MKQFNHDLHPYHDLVSKPLGPNPHTTMCVISEDYEKCNKFFEWFENELSQHRFFDEVIKDLKNPSTPSTVLEYSLDRDNPFEVHTVQNYGPFHSYHSCSIPKLRYGNIAQEVIVKIVSNIETNFPGYNEHYNGIYETDDESTGNLMLTNVISVMVSRTYLVLLLDTTK